MTVSQYKEILEVSKEGLTPLKHNIELVGIYKDLDRTTIGRMRTTELAQAIQEMQDEMRGHHVLDAVDMEEHRLTKMDFTAVRLGEFIDMEQYLELGEIDKLLAVLYRRKFDGGMVKHTYEPYNQVDIKYRAERFSGMPAAGLVKIWQEYVNYRNELVGVYQSLFEAEVAEMTEDDVLTEDERKTMEARNSHDQFAWESLIMFLCGDDVTKWKKVCDLPVILAFNIASYQKAVRKN